MRKNNFMNKIIKLKGSILAGIIQIFACLIVIILYLIFDYPHKHYTFKYFEV